MINKFKLIKKLISNTPIVEITYLYNNKKRKVYAKCEWFSLTGSIKDKPAYQIFYDAYKSGKLKQTDKIVEVSSGNMGIAICAMGNLLGNEVNIIMPKTMSEERKKLIKLYGAKLIEVNNFTDAFNLCEKYKNRGYFCTSQFESFSNYKSHYNITAKEIYKKLKDKHVNSFVAGVGTSGTLSGIGSYLKKKLNCKVIAIEPKNAKILSGKSPYGKHKLQGLSDEIVPKLYDKNIVDSIISVTDNDAIAISQNLAKELSLGVGISSGANFLGCVLNGKNAATVFPDDNKKYLSTDLTKNVKSKLADSIKFLNLKVL